MIPSAVSSPRTALHRRDVSAHRIQLLPPRLLGKGGQTDRLLQKQKPVKQYQRCQPVKALITVVVDKDPEKEAGRKHCRTVRQAK